MYAVTLLIILLLLVLYLSGGESAVLSGSNITVQNHDFYNQEIMEYLTSKLKWVEKDYSRLPEGFKSSPYGISGTLHNDCAELYYQFPLIEKITSQFIIKLTPDYVSKHIDSYGIPSSMILQNGGKTSIKIPFDPVERANFEAELKRGNWIIDHSDEPGPDYRQLVLDSLPFCQPIAEHIFKDLQYANADSFFNRIQAALNFIQFIPYGQPNFNTDKYFFGGLALPTESFVLNYSDCDSKSIFFAAILAHLIEIDNIILVYCQVAELGQKPENHMMVGVHGLSLASGQHVMYSERNYTLLETTSPCVIGDWHWNDFDCQKIESLTI